MTKNISGQQKIKLEGYTAHYFGINEGALNNNFRFISTANDGSIYAAGDHGISKFNGQFFLNIINSDEFNIHNDNISSFYKSDEDVVYFSTKAGNVFKYFEGQLTEIVNDYEGNIKVNKIKENRLNHRIYLFTNKGIYYIKGDIMINDALFSFWKDQSVIDVQLEENNYHIVKEHNLYHFKDNGISEIKSSFFENNPIIKTFKGKSGNLFVLTKLKLLNVINRKSKIIIEEIEIPKVSKEEYFIDITMNSQSEIILISSNNIYTDKQGPFERLSIENNKSLRINSVIKNKEDIYLGTNTQGIIHLTKRQSVLIEKKQLKIDGELLLIFEKNKKVYYVSSKGIYIGPGYLNKQVALNKIIHREIDSAQYVNETLVIASKSNIYNFDDEKLLNKDKAIWFFPKNKIKISTHEKFKDLKVSSQIKTKYVTISKVDNFLFFSRPNNKNVYILEQKDLPKINPYKSKLSLINNQVIYYDSSSIYLLNEALKNKRNKLTINYIQGKNTKIKNKKEVILRNTNEIILSLFPSLIQINETYDIEYMTKDKWIPIKGLTLKLRDLPNGKTSLKLRLNSYTSKSDIKQIYIVVKPSFYKRNGFKIGSLIAMVLLIGIILYLSIQKHQRNKSNYHSVSKLKTSHLNLEVQKLENLNELCIQITNRLLNILNQFIYHLKNNKDLRFAMNSYEELNIFMRWIVQNNTTTKSDSTSFDIKRLFDLSLIINKPFLDEKSVKIIKKNYNTCRSIGNIIQIRDLIVLLIKQFIHESNKYDALTISLFKNSDSYSYKIYRQIAMQNIKMQEQENQKIEIINTDYLYKLFPRLKADMIVSYLEQNNIKLLFELTSSQLLSVKISFKKHEPNRSYKNTNIMEEVSND